MPKAMKKLTLTILGWIISGALLVGLAMRLDWSKTWHSLIAANAWWLIVAACTNLAVVSLKAVRWQWIMYTKKTHFRTIFKATMIGLAGNNVLPARGGDWYRIYLLGKWGRISRAALASVTGLDKLFDGIAILGLFALLSLRSSFPPWVKEGTLIVTGVIIGSLIICILLRIHHRRSNDVHPDSMSRLRQIIFNLGAGMSILEEKGRFGATLVLSFIIAALQIATLYMVQRALGITLPLWIPVLVFVAINLAMTVPSAPSGIGPFEVAAVLAYVWLGVSKEMGFNIALLYHVVQVIPVTLIGAYYYFTAYRHEIPKERPHASTTSAATDD
jgi:uncharacterized protein (TIRG00374 family)